ncbi:Rec8 like protein-domain-containing protein [Fimicolochytrium jonesii]|uniref:Rec8 like protein-domain-containing protein n=1 Tax=Fimicolochytrium jonesii TaxID=1396493 RepID=UPI0022FEDDEA|nr:Rec8 like protein-domain-containing protein [Fimicolochytrium jonesii]KAI8818981.1 Rec8 like protein-domain-containing protein [Fimicolochytrium jonesii]
MFYSQDIFLSKGQGGLGIVWLAATLGPKHSFKKLTKREVNGVDLIKACEFLSSPPQPLALRLTSNMMVGVTRVYSEQYAFLYSEVNQVFLKLRRSWADNMSGDLDMPVTEARYDAITLQTSEADELQREQPLVLKPSLLNEKRMDLGWIFQTGPNSTESPSFLTGSPSGLASISFGAQQSSVSSPHVGSLKSITLDQSHRLSEISFPQDRRLEFKGQEDPLMLASGGPDLMMDGGAGDFDLFADIGDDHNAAAKKPRGNIENLDMPFPAFDDLDMGLPDHEPMHMAAQAPLAMSDQVAPDIMTPVENYGEGGAQTEAHSKLRQKRKRVFIDMDTELTSEDLRDMRNNALTDLMEAERQARIRAKIRKDKGLLQTLLRIPSLDVGPALTSFWEKTVIVRKRAAVHTTEDLPQTKRRKGDVDNADAAHHETASSRDAAFGQFEDYYNDGVLSNSVMDASVDDAEVLRAGNERRKSELMPWQRSSRAGSVASEQTGSILSRGQTPLSKRASFAIGDDPAYSGLQRSGSYLGGMFGDMSPLKDISDMLDDGGSLGELNDSQMAGADLDALQFFDYVKDLTLNAEDGNGEIRSQWALIVSNYELTPSPVMFLDMLPPVATSRAAATQAFYHVLALASRGALIPIQELPYEDIRLQIGVSL